MQLGITLNCHILFILQCNNACMHNACKDGDQSCFFFKKGGTVNTQKEGIIQANRLIEKCTFNMFMFFEENHIHSRRLGFLELGDKGCTVVS